MSDHVTISVRRLPDGKVVQVLEDGSTRALEDRTDYARLTAMSEAEIEANALSDSDNPPMTQEELDHMRPVPNPELIRQRLGLTQEQFAARFHLRVRTVRDWEQGIRQPDSAAKVLVRVIDKTPTP
jgi:putative transcriptional regulator